MGYIVIVGKSASGKSTIANILSEDFKIQESGYSNYEANKRWRSRWRRL